MILIGERINATRRHIRNAIRERDEEAIASEIARQDQAGAHWIDLNAGTGDGNPQQEAGDLCWLVDCALAATRKKVVLDSADPLVLRKAADHLAGRRTWMLNSIKLSARILAEGLALAREHQAPVIALAMAEGGVPRTVEERLQVARCLVAEAEKRAVVSERLFIDPLAFPISADITQGMVTMGTIQRIKAELPGVRTVLGISNASHGLKRRAEVNGAFLVAAIAHGLDAAICDPTRRSLRQALILGGLIAGRDRHCRRFSQAVRAGLFAAAAEKGEPK